MPAVDLPTSGHVLGFTSGEGSGQSSPDRGRVRWGPQIKEQSDPELLVLETDNVLFVDEGFRHTPAPPPHPPPPPRPAPAQRPQLLTPLLGKTDTMTDIASTFLRTIATILTHPGSRPVEPPGFRPTLDWKTALQAKIGRLSKLR